ncbi:hypothetical protein J2S25_002787 [Mesobacillus stamsii]|uniref:XkdX family protein n=1 Tax=Mesobacillus stamsii TaxID=225347 RepID=A0ABU0FYZ7_9BACI|nr:hypothetical protein [Mesobacillus stamsii]
MSRLYPFILNMWIMGKDEIYVNNAAVKGYITEEEKITILATPKL